MSTMPEIGRSVKDSDLYRRYVGLLDQQEDLLAEITNSREEFTTRQRRLRQQLSDYILSLEVE